MKKGSEYKGVTLDAMVAEGKCMTKLDGQVVFVKGMAPGDIVDLKIIRKKKNFAEAMVTSIVQKSEYRVDPVCDYVGVCGGCKWQHLSYEEQVKWKNIQVNDTLQHLGQVDIAEQLPIVGAEDIYHYRNKMEYTFSSLRWLTQEEIEKGDVLESRGLGFHVPRRFDKVVDIEKCHLQDDFSNTLRNKVRSFAFENDYTFYDIKGHHGELRNLIVRNTSTNEWMLIVQFGYCNKERRELILNELKNSFPELTSLMYVVNQKKNDTYSDLDVELFSGKDHILEVMDGLKFKIGPKSFFQTNYQQALKLYRMTVDLAGIQDHHLVYDLYTGTGTIANYVAKSAKKVVGVEYVEDAIVDARENSKLNDIDNTVFYAGDMKDVLTSHFINENGRPDIIITDPPRAGMHESVVKRIIEAAPQKIVYVSCNPGTQARDLQLLSEKYKVTISQPVDMFPHTHHVENIVLLELK